MASVALDPSAKYPAWYPSLYHLFPHLFDLRGHSMVVGPMGDIRVEAQRDECSIAAEIDMADVRSHSPTLKIHFQCLTFRLQLLVNASP